MTGTLTFQTRMRWRGKERCDLRNRCTLRRVTGGRSRVAVGKDEMKAFTAIVILFSVALLTPALLVWFSHFRRKDAAEPARRCRTKADMKLADSAAPEQLTNQLERRRPPRRTNAPKIELQFRK